MRTRNYKANLDEIAEGYQNARDCEFDTELTTFIRETKEEYGVVTEDDVQGFVDSFDFPDEYEWAAAEYESQRDSYYDAKYEEMKDERMTDYSDRQKGDEK